MNTFGRTLRLTTFGESHGPGYGGIIDGMPPGVALDLGLITDMLDERRPGRSFYVSQRQEPDVPEFLSGLTFRLVTLGTPIAFLFRNHDQRPQDYEEIKHIYRPNHADFTYMARYGFRDPRGGGRSSARETVNWVFAGAVVLSWLHTLGIEVTSRLISVGNVTGDMETMLKAVEEAKREGDSIGGMVECVATGVPAGVGNPVFDKLHVSIGSALMSINGVKGVEYGDGFEAAHSTGSQQADQMMVDSNGNTIVLSNHSGGIQGGISNGLPIIFRVAFKPTPTIAKPLHTITDKGEEVVLEAKGRHDPCIALRGTVVCRAMMALAIADGLLSSGIKDPKELGIFGNQG